MRTTIWIWIISFIALPTSTFAQSADCRSIADSLERLRCYDAQPAPPAAAPPPQTVKPAARPRPGRYPQAHSPSTADQSPSPLSVFVATKQLHLQPFRDDDRAVAHRPVRGDRMEDRSAKG